MNRYNIDIDYNYSEELIESFISESNGGISVFIACTEPKVWNFLAVDRSRSTGLGCDAKEFKLKDFYLHTRIVLKNKTFSETNFGVSEHRGRMLNRNQLEWSKKIHSMHCRKTNTVCVFEDGVLVHEILERHLRLPC
jgi:hypothetical protein